MGATAEMYVVAEVHETDIGAVRVGPARDRDKRGAAGADSRRGLRKSATLIDKNDRARSRPACGQDTRIVEVRSSSTSPEPWRGSRI
jgi:hypothetical protein